MDSHLRMTQFQESEDIHDFIEAFEGIMGIQNVDSTEWVLRLTPLLNGKVWAVCTFLGTIVEYDEVKKVILSHCNVNTERCRKRFRTHIWTKNAKPNDWTAKGLKLMKRWLLPEERTEQMMDKIAVGQFLDALPQELRIWVASHNPGTAAAVAELIESYDTADSPL